MVLQPIVTYIMLSDGAFGTSCNFLTRDAMLSAVYTVVVCPSVCPSVCVCVERDHPLWGTNAGGVGKNWPHLTNNAL